MAKAGTSAEPSIIIIRKKKAGGHAAHGGAWKVAYADFVTAMMAFFLLMWLLGSTSKEERQVIQAYFKDPAEGAPLGLLATHHRRINADPLQFIRA